MNGKKALAAGMAAVAVVAAFALLWATGFAFVDLLRGPTAVTEGAELTNGAYVSADLRYIMDVCGVERLEADGSPVAYFAVAPIGNQFVMVRFPAAMYDDIAALETETGGYLLGQTQSTSFHIAVSGTVRRAGDDIADLLTRWFSGAGAWMSQAGVINAVEDYDIYLSEYYIDSDAVGPLSRPWALALSILAAALLLCAVFLFVRVGMGAYDGDAEKKGGKKPRGARDGQGDEPKERRRRWPYA